jgi:hypothetical protein
LLSHPKGHRGPKFIRIRFIKEYAATVCAHQLACLLCDLNEHFIEFEIQTNELAKFKQRTLFPHHLTQGLFSNPIFGPSNYLPSIAFGLVLVSFFIL